MDCWQIRRLRWNDFETQSTVLMSLFQHTPRKNRQIGLGQSANVVSLARFLLIGGIAFHLSVGWLWPSQGTDGSVDTRNWATFGGSPPATERERLLPQGLEFPPGVDRAVASRTIKGVVIPSFAPSDLGDPSLARPREALTPAPARRVWNAVAVEACAEADSPLGGSHAGNRSHARDQAESTVSVLGHELPPSEEQTSGPFPQAVCGEVELTSAQAEANPSESQQALITPAELASQAGESLPSVDDSTHSAEHRSLGPPSKLAAIPDPAAEDVSEPLKLAAAEEITGSLTGEAANPAADKQDSRAEKGVFTFDQRPISSLTVNIGATAGELPTNLARDCLVQIEMKPSEELRLRPWPAICFQWEAPALAYRPLYFEEVNLERYGYGMKYLRAAQPIISAGQFFTTVPMLPYKMLAEPARTPVYTLGHYRPGSDVPYRPVLPPLSISGSAAEAGVAVGLIFAIP